MEEGRGKDPIDPHIDEEEANEEQVRDMPLYGYEHEYSEGIQYGHHEGYGYHQYPHDVYDVSDGTPGAFIQSIVNIFDTPLRNPTYASPQVEPMPLAMILSPHKDISSLV